jgi:type II secretory pathway predicted ATPase ExeA
MSATSLPFHVQSLGLQRNPFPYTPDADSYFLTPFLEQQIIELEHCILARKGFFLLSAEIGLGKSTLVRRLIAHLQPQNVHFALVVNTFLQGPELLRAILSDFDLVPTGDLYDDLKSLNIFLISKHEVGGTCCVVIDDAQNLSTSSLEMIRLLSNLETDQEKLVQILLVGQPELEDTLAAHNMRQLRSRLCKHVRLHPLTLVEMGDYVRFRLSMAEPNDKIIGLAPQALQKLWDATAGIPRLIHTVLDRCLYGLMLQSSKVIDSALIRTAVNDAGLVMSHQSKSKTLHFSRTVPTQVAPRIQRVALVSAVFSLCAITGLLAWPIVSESRLVQSYSARVDTLIPAQTAPTSKPAQEQRNDVVEASIPSPVTTVVAHSESKSQPTAISALSKCNVNFPVQELLSTGDTMYKAFIPANTWGILQGKLIGVVEACSDLDRTGVTIAWQTSARELFFPAGKEVARYQIALSNFGSLASDQVDGLMGSQTENAIAVMQRHLEIKVSGRLDPLTILILKNAYMN